VASGGKSGEIILLDAKELKEVRRWKAHDGFVDCLAFSPDSRRLASGSDNWSGSEGDVSVRVWDVEASRLAWKQDLPQIERGSPGRDRGGQVFGLAYSPDGQHLMTAHQSPDEQVSIWQADSGEHVRLFGKAPTPLSCAAWSPDGRVIATGHVAVNMVGNRWADRDNCVIRLYDPVTGREIRTLTGHTGPLQSLDFSPDSKLLASSSGGQYLNDTFYERESSDNSIRIWNVESGRELLKHDLPKAVKCVRFSPDGKQIASSAGAVGDNADVRLWKLPDFDALAAAAGAVAQVTTAERLFTGEDDTGVFSLAVSTDGKQAMTGHFSGAVCLWDTTTGKEIRHFEGHSAAVQRVELWPDGKHLLSASEDSTVRLWNLETAKEVRQFQGHKGEVHCLALSADGRLLLTASADYGADRDNSIRLWNAETGQELRRMAGPIHYTRDLLFAADAQTAYGCGTGLGGIMQWNLADGNAIHRFKSFKTPPICLALSPDGKTLAAGHAADAQLKGAWHDEENCLVRLWDLNSKSLIGELPGHSGPIADVAFTPDGRHLLTTSDGQHDAAGRFVPSSDQTVRLWDLATNREILRYNAQERVRKVAPAADGKSFLTGGDSIRLWTLPESAWPKAKVTE
jgi:WD40 repeat protein